MSKGNYVRVGAHRRAFPKRKFADGGGISRTDPNFQSAFDSYEGDYDPDVDRDQITKMVEATGANKQPRPMLSGSSTLPEPPSVGGSTAAPMPPAATTDPQTPPASMGERPPVKAKTPDTKRDRFGADTPAWLRALAGGSMGLTGGPGGILGGSLMGLLM